MPAQPLTVTTRWRRFRALFRAQHASCAGTSTMLAWKRQEIPYSPQQGAAPRSRHQNDRLAFGAGPLVERFDGGPFKGRGSLTIQGRQAQNDNGDTPRSCRMNNINPLEGRDAAAIQCSATAAGNPFCSAGAAAVDFKSAKAACMKTSGGCPATALHGSAPIAANRTDLAISKLR